MKTGSTSRHHRRCVYPAVLLLSGVVFADSPTKPTVANNERKIADSPANAKTAIASTSAITGRAAADDVKRELEADRLRLRPSDQCGVRAQVLQEIVHKWRKRPVPVIDMKLPEAERQAQASRQADMADIKVVLECWEPGLKEDDPNAVKALGRPASGVDPQSFESCVEGYFLGDPPRVHATIRDMIRARFSGCPPPAAPNP